MPCVNPKLAYWSAERNPETLERFIVFSPKDSDRDLAPFPMDCKKCPECRKKQVNALALQCAFEMDTVDNAIFITLTYNDEHLESYSKSPTGTLSKKRLKQFHKTLRRWIDLNHPEKGKYKYIQSGEYGSEGERPHYHILIMGFDFKDRIRAPWYSEKNPAYISATAQKLWKYGNIDIKLGDIAASRYITKYALKESLQGKDTVSEYKDIFTAERGYAPDCQDYIKEFGRIPQFTSRSQNIGLDKLIKYSDDYIRTGKFYDQRTCKEPMPLNSWQTNKLKELYPLRVKPMLEARKKEVVNTNQQYYIINDKIEPLPFGGSREFNMSAYRKDALTKAVYSEASTRKGAKSPVELAYSQELKTIRQGGGNEHQPASDTRKHIKAAKKKKLRNTRKRIEALTERMRLDRDLYNPTIEDWY